MSGAESKGGGDRQRWEIARDLLDTVLGDQIARGESLHAVAGVLAGLAGVVTTLAGDSRTALKHAVGQAGLIFAGVATVVAVVVFLVKRPGREPKDLPGLVRHILDNDDVELSEDVLLAIDLGAASRNERRLAAKGVLVIASGLSLAGGVAALVLASLHYHGL